MSFHVYVARPGFKEQPIPEAEWLAAAKANTRLLVVEQTNRVGAKHHVITLLDTKERLSLSPYGLIDAQAPSQALVEVMFELADSLSAGVYSERLKRYSSVADWRSRTTKFRTSHATKHRVLRRQRWLRAALWLALLATSAVAGWYISARNAA